MTAFSLGWPAQMGTSQLCTIPLQGKSSPGPGHLTDPLHLPVTEAHGRPSHLDLCLAIVWASCPALGSLIPPNLMLSPTWLNDVSKELRYS